MDKYIPDIFYGVRDLSFEQKRQLLYDAKEQCYEWWADVLDCSVSFQRRRVDMSFAAIMKKFTKDAHLVVIHRRGYKVWGFKLEIGFRAMTPVDYFLWIHLTEDKIGYFVEKYNLKGQ